MTRTLRDLLTGTHPKPLTVLRTQQACVDFAAAWRKMDRKRDTVPADRLAALATLAEVIEANMTTPAFRNEIQPMLVELRRHIETMHPDTADGWSSQHSVNDRQEYTSVSVIAGRIESRAVARIISDTYWLNLDAEMTK